MYCSIEDNKCNFVKHRIHKSQSIEAKTKAQLCCARKIYIICQKKGVRTHYITKQNNKLPSHDYKSNTRFHAKLGFMNYN